MYAPKLSALLVAALLATTAPLHAQTAPAAAAGASGAGAGAATGAAAGAISAGVVVATVAGLAVVSALTSGSSGAVVSSTPPVVVAAASATVSANQSAEAVSAVSTVLTDLQQLALKANLNNDPEVSNAYDAAFLAQRAAAVAATTAKTDADNLVTASKLALAAQVCGRSDACTPTEIRDLTFKAANSAQIASKAALYAVATAVELKNILLKKEVTGLNDIAATLERAYANSLTAQSEANKAIEIYTATTGTTGTVLTTSTGTAGTLPPTGTVVR